MNWVLAYYLLTLLNTAKIFSIVLWIAFVLLFLVSAIVFNYDRDVRGLDLDEAINKGKKHFKRPLIVIGLTAPILSFLPNKKDGIVILGLVAAQKSIGSEVEKLPPKIVKLINKELDELLGEEKK